MTTTPELTVYTVTPSSYVTGASSNYKFTLQSTIPQYTGDKVIMTFPADITLGSLTCTAGTSLVGVSCSKSGSTVTATFTYSGGVLAAAQPFDFTISGLTNPPSTKPTDSFTGVAVTDSSNMQLTQYSGSVTVTMTTPSTPTVYSLSQTSEALSTATTYTIQYASMNAMASGSAFEITYPSIVSISGSLTTCTVTYNAVTYTMTGCFVDTSNKKIYVKGGFDIAVSAGNTIAIALAPITNPSS